MSHKKKIQRTYDKYDMNGRNQMYPQQGLALKVESSLNGLRISSLKRKRKKNII